MHVSRATGVCVCVCLCVASSCGAPRDRGPVLVDGQARLGLQRWCPMGVFPFRLRDQRFPQAPLQLFS